jgi:hypothetical protein
LEKVMALKKLFHFFYAFGFAAGRAHVLLGNVGRVQVFGNNAEIIMGRE